MMLKRVFRLCLHNRRKDAVNFVLEPLGEVHKMPAGATYEVVAELAENGSIEVEFEEDLVAVWGESYSVYCDGTELPPEDQINIDVERAMARTESAGGFSTSTAAGKGKEQGERKRPL